MKIFSMIIGFIMIGMVDKDDLANLNIYKFIIVLMWLLIAFFLISVPIYLEFWR
jgi:hypothetical protein